MFLSVMKFYIFSSFLVLIDWHPPSTVFFYLFISNFFIHSNFFFIRRYILHLSILILLFVFCFFSCVSFNRFIRYFQFYTKFVSLPIEVKFFFRLILIDIDFHLNENGMWMYKINVTFWRKKSRYSTLYDASFCLIIIIVFECLFVFCFLNKTSFKVRCWIRKRLFIF